MVPGGSGRRGAPKQAERHCAYTAFVVDRQASYSRGFIDQSPANHGAIGIDRAERRNPFYSNPDERKLRAENGAVLGDAQECIERTQRIAECGVSTILFTRTPPNALRHLPTRSCLHSPMQRVQSETKATAILASGRVRCPKILTLFNGGYRPELSGTMR